MGGNRDLRRLRDLAAGPDSQPAAVACLAAGAQRLGLEHLGVKYGIYLVAWLASACLPNTRSAQHAQQASADAAPIEEPANDTQHRPVRRR